MVHQDSTANNTGSAGNPYTNAYRRELGSTGISALGGGNVMVEEMRRPATLVGKRSHWQQRKLYRARRYASDLALERQRKLNLGAAHFLSDATPTVGELIGCTQKVHSSTARRYQNRTTTAKGVEMARLNQRADCAVRVELTAINSGRECGRIFTVKPDNVIRMIYENFSSLGLFAEGWYQQTIVV